MLVEGRYLVEVRLNGYNNPTGKCHECTDGCCDRLVFSTDVLYDGCSGDELCDSYFTYCLRPFGEREVTLGCSIAEMRTTTCTSSINTDDGRLDFSQSTVLNLPNPQNFSGLGDAYKVNIMIISYGN